MRFHPLHLLLSCEAYQMIECPECCHTDRKGQVEHEQFELTGGGIYEPSAYWKDCENCSGSGEIEKDECNG